jgi:hypothetical protein
LNAPWGFAIAPQHFGPFSGALLVGDFGDGAINAFHPRTDEFLGQLPDPTGQPLRIDGLWALSEGNGAWAGSEDKLDFSAGPNSEANGLFGYIRTRWARRGVDPPGELGMERWWRCSPVEPALTSTEESRGPKSDPGHSPVFAESYFHRGERIVLC